MSFRGDDQGRRYGSVPPVQYPVAGQPKPRNDNGRRSSFNAGDDGAYRYRPAEFVPPNGVDQPHVPQDELFLPSSHGPGQSARPPAGSAGPALSGYQHQYQDPAPPIPPHAGYNPQTFAQATNFPRSQTVTLPYYHPTPPSRYQPTSPSSQNPYIIPSHSHQSYNPAAYANAATPQRQPTYPGYGYGSDQTYATGTGSQPTHAYGSSPSAPHQTAFSPQASSPALSSGPSPSVTGSDSGASYQSLRSPTYDQLHFNPRPPLTFPVNDGSSPGHAARSSSSSAAYPTTAQVPYPSPRLGNGRASIYNEPFRPDSQVSPSTYPCHPSQPSPGLQRHPTNAPLPSRPKDETEDGRGRLNGSSPAAEPHHRYPQLTQESIMEDIEAQLNGGRRSQHSSLYAQDQGTTQQWQDNNRNAYAGLRTSANKTPNQPGSDDSDSDVGPVDLDALSGGYAANLTYGNDVGSPPTRSSLTRHDQHALPESRYFRESYHAATYSNVEIDYGDTGGLQHPRASPGAYRLSFDDGDERVSVHSRQSGTESPLKDDYHDTSSFSNSRPLPPLPPGTSSDSSSLFSAHGSQRSQYPHSHSVTAESTLCAPDTPEANYYAAASTTQLPPGRSVSLSSYTNTTQVEPPARSRTDAAEERRNLTRTEQLQTHRGASIPEYETGTPTSMTAFEAITLPSGRKRKLVPPKLTAADFRGCQEPWAFSSLEAWIRDMAEGDLDLKERVVEDALMHLFTFKVPTMNVADAEGLSTHLVKVMLQFGVLVPDEEWVKIGNGHISGVLWQLTGTGCYSPRSHDQEISGRCYSYHCTRTLKRVDLNVLSDDSKPTDDWHIFYNLKKEDWESKPKKEVDRQNILHEIVTGEENYLKQLDVFRKLYRDDLRAKSPPVIHPDRRDKFLTAVFGKIDPVLRVNKEHLLAQLKYRQQEQGPWITGFSDLFREWIRKAKSDYIEYATGYPRAVYMVRKEADRNTLFKIFLADRQRHKSSLKQDWTHFLIAPLQRLQRYILLLESVEQKMLGDSEEKTNLNKAISEIKQVTKECDEKVEETNRRVEMMELDRMLVIRPGFQSTLNLDHLGRKLLMQGDLQRLGSKGVRWVDTHALLFDHYLILAKEVVSRDGRGGKKYDVSREPIPMPLLFLVSMNDEAVIKQKGITAPLTRTTAAPSAGSQLNKGTAGAPSRPGIEHTSTSSSIGSGGQLTPTASNDFESKILYPFRIKHLGHEVYTLYASSARDRLDWCNSIIEAKTRHARALYSQNAEPFRLRVLADVSFNYDSSSIHGKTTGVPVKGTPLDRSIQDIESVLGPAQGVAPSCRSQVNCATGFSAFGKSLIAVGTDYGVFISDSSDPRGWSRTVQTNSVTQIAVLEQFAICLLISDRSLMSYPLDVLAPVSDFAAPPSQSIRRSPLRIAKDVTYFATAKMKDRMLVFYKKREGLHTSFKVLEPILHKATEKKSRLFGGRAPLSGVTDSFRDFDEFFFPAECYSLSLFQSYIAVATQKGMEMLTLDKKQPMSIPDLKTSATANIASRIRDQKPLGMFRLNENEFLLTYEDCAVYVDRHGDISRTLIMEYTGKQKKAKGATMFGHYLLLFNEDYVEVRNADNGRLRQIIAGRDVRIIDYGVRGPTGTDAAQSQQIHGLNGVSAGVAYASKGTVKIAMSHPEVPGKQIILEMLLNEGHVGS